MVDMGNSFIESPCGAEVYRGPEGMGSVYGDSNVPSTLNLLNPNEPATATFDKLLTGFP